MYGCLKNAIPQIDRINEWLLLSASFKAKFIDVFSLSTGKLIIKFLYILLARIKKYGCLKNVIPQIERMNEWLLLSASFKAKFFVGFFLNTGKLIFLEVSF